MRIRTFQISAFLIACSLGAPCLGAQSSERSNAGTTAGSGPAGGIPSPFAGGPWVTGVNVWAGAAVQTRTASHNELFDGSLTLVGVQLTRSLFERGGVHFTWIVEALPVMLVTSGAPANRVPTIARDPVEASDPKRLARYAMHDSYGIGLAPLSAEASRVIAGHVRGVFTVTSGGALFTHVVPYGKATWANFSVSPALSLEWQSRTGQTISAGYTLHHLSNMSFGAANPGMNSHVFFMRVGRPRNFR